MRRFALLLVLLVVVAPSLSAGAAASPQPTPVCRFCGGLFEGAAESAGVNASVASSEVDVRVAVNGSARWTVRLELASGSTAFAESPRRLESTARALLEDGYGLPEGARYLDASLEGDTAVLRYRDPDATHRHAGLLVVESLHDRGGEPWYHVNADRFTIRGPDGTVVANDPESGRVDGSAVTWTGEGRGETYAGTDLEGSPYVVFGPDRSAATRLYAAGAVALATVPIVASAVTRFLLVQTGLFAVLLGVAVAAFGRFQPRPRVGVLAAVVGILGLVGAVGPAVMNGPEWVTGPPLLAIGLAGLGLHPAARAHLQRPRAQALAVGGLVAVAYGVLLGIHVALAADWTNPLLIALRATALAFPLAAMVPLGGALATRPDRVRPWYALAVLGFVVATATVVNLVDPPTGLGAGVYAIALGVGAVVASVLGTLGMALGGTLATD